MAEKGIKLEQLTGYGSREAVVQNLKDAGCAEEVIACCMACMEQGKKQELLRRLEEHRNGLLQKPEAGELRDGGRKDRRCGCKSPESSAGGRRCYGDVDNRIISHKPYELSQGIAEALFLCVHFSCIFYSESLFCFVYARIDFVYNRVISCRIG